MVLLLQSSLNTVSTATLCCYRLCLTDVFILVSPLQQHCLLLVVYVLYNDVPLGAGCICYPGDAVGCRRNLILN